MIYIIKINKAPETMTAKERTKRTFFREKTDRVPMKYEANAGIHKRVSNALGIYDCDHIKVCEALGTDYRSANVKYNGPNLFKAVDGCNTDPVYGFYTRWVENQYGGYMDFCNYPLKNVSDDEIASFPVVNADDYDYSTVCEKLKRFKDYGIFIGGAGMCDVMNSLERLMGMEDILINLHTENEATIELMNRKNEMELGMLDRILNISKGQVDFLWMGEDLGTQNAPMIGLDLYRRTLKPQHKKFIDLAKAYNIPVLFHACGSSSWVYDDLIEMGVTAVDTLQPEAKDMSPLYLKEKFGDRLAFHGCISTGGALGFGTESDVINTVKNTLEIMMQPASNATGDGYFLSPTHWIQDTSPAKNVIALYQAGHDFGRYN